MSDDHAEAHKSNRERLLEFMSDLQWYSHLELRNVAGTRYSARLLELKRLGYEFESKPMSREPGNWYRLVSNTPGKPLGKKVKVYLEEDDVIAMLEEREISEQASEAIEQAYYSFVHNKGKL